MILRNYLRLLLIRLVKLLFFLTPIWKYFLPVMKFDMSIAQINFMIEIIKEIKNDGIICEIGVGGGATSVFLNQANIDRINPRPFYAIDTFYGFKEEDIRFEIKNRDKKFNYHYSYRSNTKDWYTKTLIAHGIKNANVIKCDAKLFDFGKIPKIAFCLIDIDLYVPTKNVLPKVYNNLIPGGVIIIDDCSPLKSKYDGAGEAYREFCKEINQQEEVIFSKLGIIRK